MIPSTARITVKGQLTIPKSVRESLKVAKGDSVVFEEKNGEIIVRKATSVDATWAKGIQATLSEWEDEIDDDL
jgi:AbrB family looped-hinge helix DNA binding protein